MYELCAHKSGYLWNFVCTEADSDISTRINVEDYLTVVHLTESLNLLHKCYNLLHLTGPLMGTGVNVTGTYRLNRKYISVYIKNCKLLKGETADQKNDKCYNYEMEG
jgi:hypothetical protein